MPFLTVIVTLPPEWLSLSNLMISNKEISLRNHLLCGFSHVSDKIIISKWDLISNLSHFFQILWQVHCKILIPTFIVQQRSQKVFLLYRIFLSLLEFLNFLTSINLLIPFDKKLKRKEKDNIFDFNKIIDA